MSRRPAEDGHQRREDGVPPVRVLAWELTRACNLSCPYCRASAGRKAPGELSTARALDALDQFARLGRPLLIVSGGEPLMRPDLFEIIDRAVAMGFPTALATNGTLIEDCLAERLKAAGLRRVSVSLDYPDARRHESVRGEGSFDAAWRGIESLKSREVSFQINMTVGPENAGEMGAMRDLAEKMGADAFHLFFVVEVGRARGARQGLAPAEYERVLNEAAVLESTSRLPMRITCAPQYRRIRRERGLGERAGRGSSGCMAGRGFLFVSATGEVKPCGYFDLVVGRVDEGPLDQLWREAEVFRLLRQPETFGGKCGICVYRESCGGCRARAYAETGDFLREDPACVYNP